MVIATAAGMLATLALAQQADTVFSIPPGSRLDLDNHSGSVEVRTWERDAVRVEADLPGRARLDIRASGSVIRVRSEGPGGTGSTDYRITVPAAIALAIRGTSTDIAVDGVQGEVLAETVSGDIDTRGGAGRVVLGSVSGSIASEGARGRVEASSTSGDVRIVSATAAIRAESTSGDIVLLGVVSESVEAEAVSGEITYEGTIGGRGRYRFSTHNGDITLSLPDPPDAAVTLSTLSGEFETTFPISQLETTGRHRRTFILGSGSATLEIGSFSGDVALRGRELND